MLNISKNKILRKPDNTVIVTKRPGTGSSDSGISSAAVHLPRGMYAMRVNSVYLMTGKQRQFRAVDSHGSGCSNSFVWTSSAPDIASVDEKGMVSGKKPGKVDIFVCLKDKDENKEKESASFSVIVTDIRMVAHRGLCTEAPGDTFAAVELAGEAGFWGVEVDVFETKQDIFGHTGFILSHDRTISSFSTEAASDKEITDFTYGQLKKISVDRGKNAELYDQTLCTLENYLDLCRVWDLVPYIDIKNKKYSDDGVKKMISIINEKDMLDRVHIVSSKKGTQTRLKKEAAKRYHKNLTVQMNARTGFHKGIPVMEQAELSQKRGFSGISLYYKDMNEEIDRYAREYEMKVTLWPLKAEQKSVMEKLSEEYQIYSIMVEGVF